MKHNKFKPIKDVSRRLMPLSHMVEKVVDNKKKKYVRVNEKAKLREQLKKMDF
jgi:uncharacterized protein (DUF2225 family)